MKKVVIAGANSFVASHFVLELLEHNFHVIGLVRGNQEFTADQRMHHALEDTTLDIPLDSGKLIVVDYELLDEDFDLSEDKLRSIFDEKVDYFHFAASLKFDYSSREEIYGINVGGVENALGIFNKYATSGSRFFFISTAYSCGKISDTFYEKFYPDKGIDHFRNYYEHSKRMAENKVGSYIDDFNLNGHIIRPSQITGNSRTGVTRTDYGIFDFVRQIHFLAQKYPNQVLRIPVNPDANQNLISINTVVSDLMSMIRSENLPIVMNFVSKHPLENRKIVECINDLLPITLIPDVNIGMDELNEVEKMILEGMSFSANYSDTNILFDTTERDKIISREHHEVNELSVFAMLAYFLNWVAEESHVDD